jgi:hypothetical protein
MSSSPSLPSTSSTNGTDDKSSRDNSSLTLVEAMKAADSIRQAFLKRSDPKETEQLVPPGTWQGAVAFAATGLLMTPFRRSILKMTGQPNGQFQGFVDLVVTPILAVGAAQVGLVIGTLYGSSYYLDRLAMDAATTTTTTTTTSSSPGSSKQLMSVRFGRDDKMSFSPTTEGLAAERESTVAELCQEVLSLSLSSPPPSSEASIQTPSLHTATALVEREAVSFSSWDPRSKTMKSLHHAVDNCRRREY